MSHRALRSRPDSRSLGRHNAAKGIDVAKGGDGAKSALREIFFVSSGVTQASQLAMPVRG
jgi:hypothetical protein